jgi:hypothetical protein
MSGRPNHATLPTILCSCRVAELRYYDRKFWKFSERQWHAVQRTLLQTDHGHHDWHSRADLEHWSFEAVHEILVLLVLAGSGAVTPRHETSIYVDFGFRRTF